VARATRFCSPLGKSLVEPAGQPNLKAPDIKHIMSGAPEVSTGNDTTSVGRQEGSRIEGKGSCRYL
jgi:hypothetical protein